MIILIALAALAATTLGGVFALKFKDHLHLILGFSAGAIIGVAFFDLLPEAIELGKGSYDISHLTAVTALGFITYTVLDRFIFFHSQKIKGIFVKDTKNY
jgi:ZIP family zinc transporter